ncbi:MAG: hypothetical protein FWD61_02175 [Phycisphaerales bacterium]|nr:hypothetical protein [Phycisphaerales bacterium]
MVAGYYTGDRTVIKATATHDLAIQHHESIHEQICNCTPDGQSLGILLTLAQERENGVATPGHLAASFEELFNRSEFAQEVSATYLGVKQMPSDSHDSILERLDPKYSDYFNEMKSVLDHRVKSSYLQYLMGWNIVTIAFWSPLLKRLVATGFQTPVTLTEDESPDFRLKSLLKTCDRLSVSEWDALMSRLQATADMFCAERGWRTWDLQDEDAWIEAGKAADAKQVEIAISVSMRSEFEKLAAFSFLPVIDEPLYVQLQTLLRNFGINLARYRQPSPGDAPDQIRIAEAWFASNSEIVNPFAKQVPPRNDLVLQLWDLPLTAMTLMGRPDSPKKGRTWIFEALFAGKDDAEKRMIIGSTSEEHVVHWLQRRRTHIEEGHPVASLTLLVAVHDASDYARTAHEIVNATFVQKSDGSPFLHDGDQVFWYVDGNLVNWLEAAIKAAHKVKTVVMVVGQPIRLGTTLNPMPFDDTFLKIYKPVGTPGYVCRIVTKMAQAHLGKYERDQEQQGVFTFGSSNDAEGLVSSVGNRLLPLLIKWWPSI